MEPSPSKSTSRTLSPKSRFDDSDLESSRSDDESSHGSTPSSILSRSGSGIAVPARKRLERRFSTPNSSFLHLNSSLDDDEKSPGKVDNKFRERIKVPYFALVMNRKKRHVRKALAKKEGSLYKKILLLDYDHISENEICHNGLVASVKKGKRKYLSDFIPRVKPELLEEIIICYLSVQDRERLLVMIHLIVTMADQGHAMSYGFAQHLIQATRLTTSSMLLFDLSLSRSKESLMTILDGRHQKLPDDFIAKKAFPKSFSAKEILHDLYSRDRLVDLSDVIPKVRFKDLEAFAEEQRGVFKSTQLCLMICERLYECRSMHALTLIKQTRDFLTRNKDRYSFPDERTKKKEEFALVISHQSQKVKRRQSVIYDHSPIIATGSNRVEGDPSALGGEAIPDFLREQSLSDFFKDTDRKMQPKEGVEELIKRLEKYTQRLEQIQLASKKSLPQ